MPTYEYKCQDCGKIFEVRQRFSDDALKTHEECGGVVNRLLSVPALQFKGTGWYVTDYAKSGSLPPGKKSDGSSDSKSEGSSESKGESKGESKSDSKSSSPSSTSSTPAAAPATASSDKK